METQTASDIVSPTAWWRRACEEGTGTCKKEITSRVGGYIPSIM